MLNRSTESSAVDFSRLMIEVFHQSPVGNALSVGYRLGLFEVLANLPNATARQIALTARLNEDQVREWLSKLVTGSVIDYDAKARTYSLPAKYAEFLTDFAAYDFAAYDITAVPDREQTATDTFDDVLTRSFPQLNVQNVSIHDTDCDGFHPNEVEKPLFERDWEYFVVTQDPKTGAYRTQTLCCDSVRVTPDFRY